MESPFAQKAIPMVSVNQSTGKYELTNEAIQFLRAIQGPIAVVSVAGLYRTGKSYLLNRVLLNRSNGFGVGPTVNPCTKGLWCWATPIKGVGSDGEPVTIIVIDTEGIGALDEDQTHDTKIFTLAILASSCFIYNSVGSIDQNAIQNLSLVVNLSKHIQLKATSQDQDGEDPDQISTYFPTFYWVVRDFSLQLQDAQGNAINSKEYLERALAPQNGFSDDVEQKNRIRRLLTSFFKDRDCFTMIRPLVDEHKLQNLDKMDYDELRPEFVHQAMSFRKRILSSVKVKSLQNQKLNGEMYCSMINSYVNAINEGAVPNIQNAWNYMCQEQCRKTLDDCYELFIKEMKEGFREFPKPQEDFSKCVAEAEEKALEAFRQRALGEKSNMVLKELKSRIRSQITQAREQNIKESNEEMRKYILKQINPIKLKLNNQQYKTYPEFEKEVLILSDRLVKEGPKLHNCKLIYMEAMRKFSSQGAQFLFKNFSKQQEKDKEMFKVREKELQTQLETIRSEKDVIRKEYNEFTTTSDQKLSDLSYKLETMTTQLTMTSKAKDEEQKKMERQFTTKYHEIQSNRRGLEERIRQLMERLQQNNRTFNTQKKQWQKQMAVLDLKTKQQSIQIDELNRKQKTLDANLNISKNQMSSQVREITQRHERQKEEIKLKLKQFEEKCNELTEQLTVTKEEIESKTEKFDKKQKKFKEDLANKNKQIEKTKKDFQVQRMQLRDQLDSIKDNSTKYSTVFEQKLREAQKNLKQFNDRYRKQKYTLESDKELIQQRYELMQMQYETLKKNHLSLKEQHQQTIASLQTSFLQRNDQVFSTKLTELKSQHETELSIVNANFENQRKRLHLELNNLSRKCEEYELQYQTLKHEITKRTSEQQNIIEQLNDQIKHQKNTQKALEGQKVNGIWEIESRYKNMIKQLENQIEEIKERAHNEKSEHLKHSQESISQIKNGYQMEKQNLERRIRNEKDKYERRINDLTTQHDRKLEEETEPLLNEIQQVNERLINLQEMLRNQSIQMQHQIDINVKRAENAQKANTELREMYERKEKEFTNKYDGLYMQSKSEKEKLQSKIQGLIDQKNKKDKELMTIIHNRDQLSSTLQKKQNKLREVQTEFQTHKEHLQGQIEKFHNKISTIERQNHDKITNYQRQNALLKQKNQFSLTKIEELEKTLEMTNQIYEEKMSRFKQQKETETRITIEKIQSERNSIETKYKEFKTSAKDSQNLLKKAVTELGREKDIMQVKIVNLEGKYRDLEEKKATQVTSLQAQLTKFKESYNNIKSLYDSDANNYRAQNQRLESQYNDMSLKFEKEKSLSEQKIVFLTNSKQENKRDSEERIKKLQAELSQVHSIRSNEKSSVDKLYNETLRNSQNKHYKKITQLNEEILKKSSEYEGLIKDKDQQIRELREKYQTEKLQRETLSSKMEKRLNEVFQNQRRLRDEIDRLKSQRERRESEFQKKEKQERQMLKNKMAVLEGKVKDSESERMKGFYEFEKQRSKWNFQKDNIIENSNNLQDHLKKLEKERDKFRIQVEKLKTERKSTKTHSYIGNLKTTYEPPKAYIEETNKENVHQQ